MKKDVKSPVYVVTSKLGAISLTETFNEQEQTVKDGSKNSHMIVTL